MKRIMSLGLLLLMLHAPIVKGQPHDQHIIWTQRDSSQYGLYLRAKNSGLWSSNIFKIEESANPIITPTFSMNQKGDDMWVAWTEVNGQRGRLWYRTKRKGSWSSSRELATSTTSDMAPALMVDQEGIPWMVWSGTDDTDDDIYSSRWINGKWQKPQRVNADDNLPDILPEINIDVHNQITVSWLGYNGHRYVRYSAQWSGSEWNAEEVVSTEIKSHSIQSAQDLPAFIPNHSQGASLTGQGKAIRKFRKQ